MGNQPTKQIRPYRYEWERVANENGVQIFRRKEDGIIAEKRTIILDSRYSLDNEQIIYDYRNTNISGLVKTYEAWPIDQSLNSKNKAGSFGELCKCSELVRLNVFSERIQYRLSQLPQLKFQESLQFLKHALPAYEIIYNKMGPLHINQQLIGINDKGQIKVWVNENWALNHPSHQIPTLKSTNINRMDYNMMVPELRDQAEMISNLINVIEEKTQNGRFPEDFKTEITSKSTSFRQTKKYLNHFTTEDNRNFIPQILKRTRVSLTKNVLITNNYTANPVTNYSASIYNQIPPKISNQSGVRTAINQNIATVPFTISQYKQVKTQQPLAFQNSNAGKITFANTTSTAPLPFQTKFSNYTSNMNWNADLNSQVKQQKIVILPPPSTSTTTFLNPSLNINNLNTINTATSTFTNNYNLAKVQPYNFNNAGIYNATKVEPFNFNNFKSTYTPTQYNKITTYSSSSPLDLASQFTQKTSAGNYDNKNYSDLKYNFKTDESSTLKNTFKTYAADNHYPLENVKSSLLNPISPHHSLGYLLDKDQEPVHEASFKIADIGQTISKTPTLTADLQ